VGEAASTSASAAPDDGVAVDMRREAAAGRRVASALHAAELGRPATRDWTRAAAGSPAVGGARYAPPAGASGVVAAVLVRQLPPPASGQHPFTIHPFTHPAMDRITTLAAEWERAKNGTQDYLDAVSAEHLAFRPTPEARSLAELFVHLGATQYAFAASATGRTSPLGDADPEEDAGLTSDADALRRFVLGSYDFLADGVRALDPAVLDEEVAFFRLRMPRSLLLAKALEHHAHHRGQASVYLRLAGVTPPGQRLF
jgi:uncharacterized damage-inducible protein DinB